MNKPVPWSRPPWSRPPRSRRRRSRRHYAILPCLLLLASRPGLAAEVSAVLAPGDGTVALRAYGMGLLPFDGRFTRFNGRFSYDPADHARCSVALHIDAPSLEMGSDSVGETVLGPDFLDAARFPALAYDGTCDRAGLTGMLTMRGVTRPFALTLDWGKAVITAIGRVQRAAWGMTARPLLVGQTIRITVTLDTAAAPAAGR